MIDRRVSEYFGDSTELVYLRARQYAPGMGRFLTRDTWGGSDNQPMSYNKWNYADSNPINRIDPSGHCWYPNSQTGGISFDVSNPSPGMCNWFIDMFEQQGITIPANSTPGNWLNSLPSNIRQQIALDAGCSFPSPAQTLSQGHDFWMVIRFYTNPKWEYYETTSTTAEFKLVLGIGGGGSLSCDNNTQGCSLIGSVDIGEAGSVFGVKLGVSYGISGELDFSTGSIRLGGNANIGPCSLFVSYTRIAAGCTDPLTMQTDEIGWIREVRDDFWILVKASTISHYEYDDFARKNLPFKNPNAKIYHRIMDSNDSQLSLRWKYIDYPMYIFP